MKRVRDFAEVAHKDEIDTQIVCYALDLLRVDQCGLDDTDRRLLRTMIELYGGGPVGLVDFGRQYRRRNGNGR